MTVNLLGFQPNSIKYSPICLREPKLKSCSLRLVKGVMSFVSVLSSYSSGVKPCLDKVPSFLSLGLTSFVGGGWSL